MKVSTKAQYAVMAMVDLAKYNGENISSSLTAISERQNLPLAYLEQLFLKLRRADLVKSARGATGGYMLAKKAKETYIYDIIKAVDMPIKATRCSKGSNIGCQPVGARCLTHSLWAELENVVEKFLQNITVHDVLYGTVSDREFLKEQSTLVDLEKIIDLSSLQIGGV